MITGFIAGVLTMLLIVVIAHSNDKMMTNAIKRYCKKYGNSIDHQADSWVLIELLEIGKKGAKNKTL